MPFNFVNVLSVVSQICDFRISSKFTAMTTTTGGNDFRRRRLRLPATMTMTTTSGDDDDDDDDDLFFQINFRSLAENQISVKIKF